MMRNQTNQKLSRVKILLEQLEQAAPDEKLAAAMAEAILLELGLAYRCFLSELATANEMAALLPSSATMLAATLAEQSLYVAEVDELANLEQARRWPHTLLTAAQPSLRAGPKPVPVTAQTNLIEVMQVTEKNENNLSSLLDYAHCLEVYQALRACIDRQRDMSQQW